MMKIRLSPTKSLGAQSSNPLIKEFINFSSNAVVVVKVLA
jgi:hypothetical protein